MHRIGSPVLWNSLFILNDGRLSWYAVDHCAREIHIKRRNTDYKTIVSVSAKLGCVAQSLNFTCLQCKKRREHAKSLDENRKYSYGMSADADRFPPSWVSQMIACQEYDALEIRKKRKKSYIPLCLNSEFFLVNYSVQRHHKSLRF